ncbi:hypothetical protein H5410_052371 [Solanum commersonii]|uniref:Uncharacterized protein n=1 Tax=Solanum commersonii TaxID=4109 RepID=A0A9J5X3W8_SOLCO|nr:hypothetical protein H5410_052371 [Solanum commersonii]
MHTSYSAFSKIVERSLNTFCRNVLNTLKLEGKQHNKETQDNQNPSWDSWSNAWKERDLKSSNPKFKEGIEDQPRFKEIIKQMKGLI